MPPVRGMKENEGLYRVIRLLRHLVVGTVALSVAVVAIGYVFLMRQVDAPYAWREGMRELDGGVLHYGERVERIARVYQRRPTNYFRASNGVLAATPARLLYVGIEPRDQLAGPDAPATIITREFPNDTLLSLDVHRVYFLTAHGVVIRRGGRREEFAASRGHGPELDSLVAFVRATHRAQRTAAAELRRLRAAVAAMVRSPIRYVVRRGDAASTIASRFGATVDELRRWNSLSDARVRLGDTLIVKPAGAIPPPLRPDSAALAPPPAATRRAPARRPPAAARGATRSPQRRTR